MAESQVDPARLHGEELRRWYMRSPAEIEEQRQVAAQQRYDSYFGRSRKDPPQEDLTELRRQQAEFAKVRRQADIENSWLAAGALAPVAVVAGLEGAAALGLRALRSPWAMPKNPLSFLEREAWQGRQVADQAARGLGKSPGALRAGGRQRFAQANGKSASEMEAKVHHSWPIEHAGIVPKADPNRLANLWALPKEAHDAASAAWTTFRRSLNGRIPSPAEVMEMKMRIDRTVAPYLRSPGVSRFRGPPGGAGGAN
jgi:hypothetical protein